jgi:NAD(P)H-dependent FMN reductase
MPNGTVVRKVTQMGPLRETMTKAPTVVAICGSLRDTSYTQLALKHALAAAEDAGATTEFVDLREWDLPLFDPDDRDRGDAEALRRTVRDADAVLRRRVLG